MPFFDAADLTPQELFQIALWRCRGGIHLAIRKAFKPPNSDTGGPMGFAGCIGRFGDGDRVIPDGLQHPFDVVGIDLAKDLFAESNRVFLELVEISNTLIVLLINRI